MEKKQLSKFTGITLGGIAVILVAVIAVSVVLFNAKTRTDETPQVTLWPDIQDSTILAGGYTDNVYICADLRNDYVISASSRLAGYLMAEDSSIRYALGTYFVFTSDFQNQHRPDSIAFIREDGTTYAYPATHRMGMEKNAEIVAWLKSDQLDELFSAPIAAIGIYKQPHGFITIPVKLEATDYLRLRRDHLRLALQESLAQ